MMTIFDGLFSISSNHKLIPYDWSELKITKLCILKNIIIHDLINTDFNQKLKSKQ